MQKQSDYEFSRDTNDGDIELGFCARPHPQNGLQGR